VIIVGAVLEAIWMAFDMTCEVLFAELGLIPSDRNVAAISQGPSWNYTSVLNAVFLVLSALLVWRFLRTRGPAMLAMMDEPIADEVTVVDPVCGMRIDPAHAAGSRDYRGQTHHFCSEACLGKVDADPERYARPAVGHGAHAHGHR
jgi:YHS domain-containing protein